MNRLTVILIFMPMPLCLLAQPLEPYRHNFFTTNPAPVVEVVAGSNTTVVPSLIGTGTRRFTVSASSGATTGPWTNSGTFIWPSGQPAPDPTGTTPGPGLLLRSDGSIFLGPNVNQDTSIIDTAQAWPLYMVTMVTSNEPSTGEFLFSSLDSEQYNYWTTFTGSWHADPDIPYSSLYLTAKATNGVTHQFHVTVAPGDGPGVSRIEFKTNNTSVFSATSDGVVTAKLFSGSGSGLTGLPSDPSKLDANGGISTNLVIFGNSSRTNAVYITGSGEVLSNALGQVTISGGNITASNVTATTFTGSLSGNASSATVATNLNGQTFSNATGSITFYGDGWVATNVVNHTGRVVTNGIDTIYTNGTASVTINYLTGNILLNNFDNSKGSFQVGNSKMNGNGISGVSTISFNGGPTLAGANPITRFYAGGATTGAASGSIDAVNGTFTNTVTATNGIIFRQLSLIPTNSIPASDVGNSITNFLEVNMTNTYNGGGRMLLWSNNVSGGIFSRKATMTDTQL